MSSPEAAETFSAAPVRSTNAAVFHHPFGVWSVPQTRSAVTEGLNPHENQWKTIVFITTPCKIYALTSGFWAKRCCGYKTETLVFKNAYNYNSVSINPHDDWANSLKNHWIYNKTSKSNQCKPARPSRTQGSSRPIWPTILKSRIYRYLIIWPCPICPKLNSSTSIRLWERARSSRV